MTDGESIELQHVAEEMEGAAARLPAQSQWRGRLLQEARLLRGVAHLPLSNPESRAIHASGLRLIEGEAS